MKDAYQPFSYEENWESIHKYFTFYDQEQKILEDEETYLSKKAELSFQVLHTAEKILELTPILYDLFKKDDCSDFDKQHLLSYVCHIHFYYKVLELMYIQANEEHFFSAEQFCLLKGIKEKFRIFFNELYIDLGRLNNFSFLGAFPLHQLGKYKLKIPFTARIDRDDPGYIALCLEVPQVYGYGETAKESIMNLDKELSTMYEDLINYDNFSKEFILLKEILSMAVIR